MLAKQNYDTKKESNMNFKQGQGVQHGHCSAFVPLGTPSTAPDRFLRGPCGWVGAHSAS